jgi:hypothetical protein
MQPNPQNEKKMSVSKYFNENSTCTTTLYMKHMHEVWMKSVQQYSRLIHYHNALLRMLGSSEVRGKASLDAGKIEKVKTTFALLAGVIIELIWGPILFFF